MPPVAGTGPRTPGSDQGTCHSGALDLVVARHLRDRPGYIAKEGARHHGYTGKRGYHPLLAVAAGTGDVLMARLREGRSNTARGAAHFLRETVGRVRHAGAKGQLTVRADSGFYTHAVAAVCRKTKVRFSITIRQRASLRNLIEAIPEKPCPRSHTRGGLDAHPLLDGRRRRRGRDRLHSLPE